MKNVTLTILLASLSVPALADNKISAEFLIGNADQKGSIKNVGSTSGDDLSFGVRGSYSLNENISLEAAYHNFGQTDDSYVDEFGDTINDKISSTSINFGVKGIIPLESGFSLFGRIGLSLWDVEFEETDSAFPGEKFKADDDGDDIYYGVGVQYSISDQLKIGAEYSVIDMGAEIESISVDNEVKNLSLSLSYSL